ncbi:DUF1003 domain-containing protein [Pelagibaculum spongiae]|uniref:DUF1003 domain-containing protein n=1 Tax=Pelagibaculum spongiae TaxID=2080658 RepID=A0A2V1GS02_9GAMM|nr:DUF1003 domain-containing protein [Pelagibaculum spongiae]PVZ65637.1 hypothetical protein DC094_17270 [Pelagibaculum spongiae]
MKKIWNRISRRTLGKNFEQLGDEEQQVVVSIAEGEAISQNTNDTFKDQMTFGEKAADKIAEFGGSWGFIGWFFLMLGLWIGSNLILIAQGKTAFDQPPFILLTMVLSVVAALQAPIIMMSQNRQSKKDRMNSQIHYEVSLKLELEVTRLHQKIESMRIKLEEQDDDDI